MIYNILYIKLIKEERMSDLILDFLTKYQTKNHLVYNVIKEKIINGVLKPDEKLIIKDVSNSLGVSETPVREALKMLESENYVSLNPHVGFVVTKMNVQELKDIFAVRLNLECLATKLATNNITDEDINALIKNTREMYNCIKKNNYVNYGSLNREFHRIIYKASNNMILYKLILDLWDKSGRARSIFLLAPNIVEQSYKEHLIIIDLLKKKERIMVTKVTKKHKQRSFSVLLNCIKSQQEKISS